MAIVHIFPTGPSWEQWDAYRGSRYAVAFETLAELYPPEQWLNLDTLEDWPGEGATVVESDIAGAVGNTVILAPFSVVASAASKDVAAGVPSSSSGIWVAALLVGGGLLLWSLSKR